MSKRNLTIIVVLILILVVIFIKFQYRVDLQELELNEIDIAFTPDAKEIKISDDAQIKNIIGLLGTEKWNPYFFWRLKYSPILYVVIDDTIIGLFDFDSTYGVVNENGKIKYYTIPQDTFEKIFKIYKEHSD